MKSQTFRSYPPGKGNVLVPDRPLWASQQALILYAPCTRKAIAAHRLAWVAAGVGGGRFLKRATSGAVDVDEWGEIVSDVERIVGPWEAIALYRQPQAHRSGIAALLMAPEGPRAFLKARRRTEASLPAEIHYMRQAAGAETFRVPALLGTGTTPSWEFLVAEPLPWRPHRPAGAGAAARAAAEISERISVARSEETDPTWRPMHGDFAPWNVRASSGGNLPWVIDWEHVELAPPGADLTWFRITSAAVRRRRRPIEAPADALTFWKRRLVEAPPHSADRGLYRRLLTQVEQATETD